MLKTPTRTAGKTWEKQKTWRTEMVCLRSTSKYIFESYIAQVVEKDHDTIKRCDTIKHTRHWVFRGLYLGVGLPVSGIWRHPLLPSGLVAWAQSKVRQAVGVQLQRGLQEALAQVPPLCSGAAFKLRLPPLVSIYLSSAAGEPMPHLTARLGTWVGMLLCCWDWWQCGPEGHEKGA